MKYSFSLREFTTHKQNVQILEFLDAANDLDQHKEHLRQHKNGNNN
ncbi:MAG: hypothetical protein GY804_11815 [Alphaproteobacteria bacterium]|nr:hypothetical protein [Alphaproteobacteria bacterium]